MKEKLKEILNYYGEESQANQLIQELSELIVAITKNDEENIKEEVADVLVMLNQFLEFEGVNTSSYIKLRFSEFKIKVENELLEDKLKLTILKVQEHVLKQDNINAVLNIAKLEVLISRYLVYREMNIKEICDVAENKVDRQLRRIEREKVNK